MVFGIVRRVDAVGWVRVGALVEVVLACGGSYGRVLKFGRAVDWRRGGFGPDSRSRSERWGLE